MEFQKFGPNDVRIEGDLVYTVVHGVPGLEDCRRYLDAVAETATKYGHVFMLIDTSKGFGLSPETRRYSTEWGKTHRVTGTACFGTSAPARAMMTLVVRAMDLVSGYKSNTRFFSNEVDARAWLAQQHELVSQARKPT